MATTKRTTPNGAGQLGARLIAALVPRYFPTLSALQLAAQGPAYSPLSNWKHGKAIPEWESVEAMARLVGVDELELLAARGGDLTALPPR